LSKGANTYWDNGTTRRRSAKRPVARRRPRAAQQKTRRRQPWWLSVTIVTSIFVMLVASINLRAFREMREEADRHTQLGQRVQNLMDENLALQEEIHTLKSDPRAIEREAKRIGIELNSEQ
jgi:cell division protein FtsB